MMKAFLEFLRKLFEIFGSEPDPDPIDPDPIDHPIDPIDPIDPDPIDPDPTPWQPSMGWLAGTPQARIYWYGNNIADATPALIHPDRCEEIYEEYGWFKDRYACPVAPDDHPLRGELEVELMGGDRPVWELEVYEGNLDWTWVHGWKAKVIGKGRGRLRWKFPNGRAKSKWLEVSK